MVSRQLCSFASRARLRASRPARSVANRHEGWNIQRLRCLELLAGALAIALLLEEHAERLMRARILGIKLQFFHTPHFRPSRIAHGRTWF